MMARTAAVTPAAAARSEPCRSGTRQRQQRQNRRLQRAGGARGTWHGTRRKSAMAPACQKAEDMIQEPTRGGRDGAVSLCRTASVAKDEAACRLRPGRHWSVGCLRWYNGGVEGGPAASSDTRGGCWSQHDADISRGGQQARWPCSLQQPQPGIAHADASCRTPERNGASSAPCCAQPQPCVLSSTSRLSPITTHHKGMQVSVH